MSDKIYNDSFEFLPLREVVYLTLRRSILKEELKPGERLMENTIANKIGVSRTPVREAIRMLGQEGLVEMIPRKGARVASISRQDLNDVLEVRKSLEELAVRKACDNITDYELRELKIAGIKFKESIERHDQTEMAQSDAAFHDVIYRASKNKKLIDVLNNLSEQMYRYRLEYIKQADILASLVSEHNEIEAALKKRDGEKAASLILHHINEQQNAINRELGKSKE
ncbi:MAG: GntR family transcriptional regulator [Lachnospiraceae bacterium]|jgi:DNA-binding GntR family transcriptional regulator